MSMNPPGPLLRLNNVSKTYVAPGAGENLSILNGISLEVSDGDSVAIVGPSGSGKSTILHLMGTLDQPSAGEVLLDGRRFSTLSDTELAWIRNRELGFIFQFHYLLPHCTVLENVLVPTLARVKAPFPDAESEEAREPQTESAKDRGHRLLERVGLGARLDHRPGELSGGERQRVAVVRALINRPRLLLADEPTGSLDQQSAQELGQLLSELNREEHVAVVLVTHSPELAGRMQRLFQLKAGKLQQLTK